MNNVKTAKYHIGIEPAPASAFIEAGTKTGEWDYIMTAHNVLLDMYISVHILLDIEQVVEELPDVSICKTILKLLRNR